MPDPTRVAKRRTRTRLTVLFVLLAAVGAGAALVHGVLQGGDVAGSWQLAARYTARFAFFLFVPVYVASAWHALAPSRASRWVLQRRRSLGLAFATAHTVHLGALTTYFRETAQTPEVLTLVVGGGAYLTMFALVATSNDTAVRRLGGTRWRQLHRFGVHYLWFVFAFSYAGRLATEPVFFGPLALLAVGAFGLRMAALRARRSGASVGATATG